MVQLRVLIATCILLISSQSFAETEASDHLLKEGTLLMLAPPLVNKKYFSLEYGFTVNKRIKKYHYNAFVTGNLFEDWLDKPDEIRAGGLGFKAGGYFPVITSWPLAVKLVAGFAKTTLQKDPIVGREQQSLAKKDMFFLETGLMYHLDRYMISANYQKSNLKHFTRNFFISFGVNY